VQVKHLILTRKGIMPGITYTYNQVLEASTEYFHGDELAAKVFTDKYALQNAKGEYFEQTPTDMHWRLAKEFARIEKKYPNPMSEEEIFGLLDRFKYIVPQGSPMSAIGNPHQIQSLSNCFVVENPFDSYAGVLKTDQELAQISKRRGGVGVNISSLRPRGLPTANAAKTTDGIGVFMERFSNTIREVAQCLHKDTQILTSAGLLPISQITPGTKVWTNSGWVQVEKILHNKKKLVKLTTKSGKEILCSEDHVFHTINGEKAVKDLKVGDPITQIVGAGWNGKDIQLHRPSYRFPKRTPIDIKRKIQKLYNTGNYSYASLSKQYDLNKSTVAYIIKKKNKFILQTDIKLPRILTPQLAYLTGLMYGDGYVRLNKNDEPCGISVTLSEDWKDITNKFVTYCKSEFNYEPPIYKKSNEKCSVGCITSKLMAQFLSFNQILKEKSANIKFPEKIKSACPKVIFAFLSGYFDSDGCVSKSKKQYKLSSICKKFLLDVQIVLSSFGIASKLHTEYRSKKGWQDLYELTINGNKSQTIFRRLMHESVKIGSRHFESKKRDCTQTIYNVTQLGSNSSRHRYIMSNNQLISYSTFERLKKDLDLPYNVYLLQDNVQSIQQINDQEHDVYDLVLPKEHLFFANGLYPHNSGRRGALLIACSVHHPEVKTFINIKRDLKKVTGANISLQLSDEFMEAVKKGEKYQLRWPVDSKSPQISEYVDARSIWNEIIAAAHGTAEPGILFWDTALKYTPADIYADVGYRSICCNPCAELILSKNDSCRLLLLNLFSYVVNPYEKNSFFDYKLFRTHAQKAQRLMDDMIDLEIEAIDRIINKVKNDPEPKHIKATEMALWEDIREACINGRRTGTGITGLGDCLAALGIKYGSKKSIEATDSIYKELAGGCYASTCILASERGTFPIFSFEKEKNHPFLERIWEAFPETYKLYKKHGRRNIALTTTAPAGSASTLTQTTSGIEPAYLLSYVRRKKINPSDQNARVDFVDQLGDKWQEFTVYHHGVKKWMDVTGKTTIEDSPYYGATSNEIDWKASVKLQGAGQHWTCHALAKTCNLPSDVSVEVVKDVYMTAWESGCKGFTVYRDGSRDGVLLSKSQKEKDEEGRPLNMPISMAPKRLDELHCHVKKAKIQEEAWTIFVGLFNNQPYEVFGGLSKYVDIPNKYKTGKIIKNGKVDGITTYNLIVGDGDDQMIIKDIANVFENATFGTFTRTISLALRHGTPIQYVVEQLQKDKHSDMTSFSKVMARVLKSYIQDGTHSSDKTCPTCKKENSLVYQDGCVMCSSCSWSRCA